MKAILFCAGKSTRTYPLTLTRPKPLLKVANKPILQHNLEQLHQTELIKEVILIVGYKKEMIESWVKENHQQFNFIIKTQEQTEQLGTAHALQTVKELLGDEPFLVMNGDDFFFTDDLKNLINTKTEHAVLLHEVEDPTQYGIAEIHNGLIKKLVEKPKEDIGKLANAGAYLFSPSIFDFQPEKSARGELELTDMINHQCEKNNVSHTKATAWFPVTHPWDLLKVNTFLLSKIKKDIQGTVEEHVVIKGEVIVGKNTIIKSGVYIEGPVVIGENCKLGPNCFIRPSTSIGDSSVIGHQTEIKNSILFDKVSMRHLSYICDSVIGEHVNFGAGSVVANLRHDKANIKSMVKEDLVDSGLRKFGTIIGDNVKLGINTSIYPGRKIWPDKSTLPGESVKKDIQ